MNKEKVIKALPLVFWLGLAASEIFLAFQIHRLNMLPDNYLALAYGALAASALLLGLLMLPGKKQKHPLLQIIGYILCAAVMAGCIVGGNAIAQVHDTISSVTQAPTVSAVMDIYTRNDDTAQNLDDMADYTFGITEAFDWENTQRVMAELETHFGHAITTVTYGSAPEMIDALYAGEVDALILNSAYVTILEEMGGYSDFSQRTVLAHEHTLVHEDAQEPTVTPTAEAETQETQETQPVETQDDTTFIVYLSGSDSRNYYLPKKTLSDVNIMVVVNTETKQILLVNTPRDYYVVSPASSNGDKDKLTHCGVYGPECSMEALENLYDIQIRYYARINFTGFEKLVNAIGGVDVESDVAFGNNDDIFIRKGMNHLNGKKALYFARARKQLSGGDNARGRNQMKIVTSVIQKLSSGTTLLSNYSEILDSLSGLFTTNMTHEEISELVKMQLSDMATWNVLSVAATGTGGHDTTYATGGLLAYVMYPHEDVVAHISGLIDRVLTDEILTEADLTAE